MKRLINILLFFCIISSANLLAQNVEIVKFDKLEKLLLSKESKVVVINFWATWCAPCVKELPLFEAFYSQKPNDVSLTLVNLDFADKIEKVNSFVKLKRIKSPVFLLDEVDYNTWIDRVDTSWSGAIPATVFINTATGKRKFVEKELEEGELEQIIKELTLND